MERLDGNRRVESIFFKRQIDPGDLRCRDDLKIVSESPPVPQPRSRGIVSDHRTKESFGRVSCLFYPGSVNHYTIFSPVIQYDPLKTQIGFWISDIAVQLKTVRHDSTGNQAVAIKDPVKCFAQRCSTVLSLLPLVSTDRNPSETMSSIEYSIPVFKSPVSCP